MFKQTNNKKIKLYSSVNLFKDTQLNTISASLIIKVLGRSSALRVPVANAFILKFYCRENIKPVSLCVD